MNLFKYLLILFLIASGAVFAGRMPSDLVRVESVGGGYVKIHSSEKHGGEYNIVQTYEIKRLVSSKTNDQCYMFYFTGIELLKLIVNGQNCESILAELVKSNGH